MTIQQQTSTVKYIVYWAHLPEHTDITVEGYVGITKTSLQKRMWQHKHNAKKRENSPKRTVFDRAIAKHGYDNVVFDTVCICDKNYALYLEHALRPEMLIGWNIAKGGDEGGRFKGYKHTEEAKRKIAEAGKGRQMSAEGRAKLSLLRRTTKPPPFSQERRDAVGERIRKDVALKGPWAHRNAKSLAWKVLDKIFDIWSCGIKSPAEIRRQVGLPEREELAKSLAYIEKCGDPRQDARWIDWMKANVEN